MGDRAVRLYPLYHPAAALYTPSTLEALRADFERIPELLALDPPAQPEPYDSPLESLEAELGECSPPEPEAPEPEASEPAYAPPAPEPPPQLGLF